MIKELKFNKTNLDTIWLIAITFVSFVDIRFHFFLYLSLSGQNPNK